MFGLSFKKTPVEKPAPPARPTTTDYSAIAGMMNRNALQNEARFRSDLAVSPINPTDKMVYTERTNERC